MWSIKSFCFCLFALYTGAVLSACTGFREEKEAAEAGASGTDTTVPDASGGASDGGESSTSSGGATSASGGASESGGQGGASGSTACGGQENAMVCAPGSTRGCTCFTGETGAQVCAEDGMSYDECECEDANPSGGAPNGECDSGDVRPCVDEDGCQGLQVCSSGSSWGACICMNPSTGGTGSGGSGNTLVDVDGDGYYQNDPDQGQRDCNDFDASVNPGADEVCNGVDDDCTGVPDDGIDCGTGGSSGTGGTGGSGGGGNTRSYVFGWAPLPVAQSYLTDVHFQATINDGEWLTYCSTNPNANRLAPVTVSDGAYACSIEAVPGDRICYNVEGRYNSTSWIVEGVYGPPGNQTSYACWEDWGCSGCCQGCSQQDPDLGYKAFGDSWFEGAVFADDSTWVGSYVEVPGSAVRDGQTIEFVAKRLTDHNPDIDIQYNYGPAGGCNICLTLP